MCLYSNTFCVRRLLFYFFLEGVSSTRGFSIVRTEELHFKVSWSHDHLYFLTFGKETLVKECSFIAAIM